MSKIMYSQKWYTYYEYPLDYFELMYQYYAASGIRTPVTYYALDIPNSIIDDKVLVGGTYEKFGELSGWKWKKINMLPVYNFEQVQLMANAAELGVEFDSTTSFYLPSIYEIQPHVHDYIAYDYLQNRGDQFGQQINMFEVVNIEKTSQSKITFWKATVQTVGDGQYLDSQLSGNYTFIDYEKKIYETRNAINLQKLLLKNTRLGINDYFDRPSGLYMEKPGFKVAEQT